MPRKQRGLASSRRHCAQCERRWLQGAARAPAPATRSCQACRHFVPSAGDFSQDWGACSSPGSDCDSRLMAAFEGCADFTAATEESVYRHQGHFRITHDRWLQARPGNGTAPAAQCGDCRFFIPLDGAFIEDWGVCSNEASGHDGGIVLEHDGCAEHVRADDGWGGATPRKSLERRAAEKPDRDDLRSRVPAPARPSARRVKPAS